MNYELLLDEIMVNTVSARQLITVPERQVNYGVCPLQLEYHTSIFLAGTILSLGQTRPLLFLIQVEDLEADIMLYTWTIGPHFGKQYKLQNQNSQFSFPETTQNRYPYLDKLFAYAAVLSTKTNHQVIFIKKGAKIWALSQQIKEHIDAGYALLILSNAYQNLPSDQAKKLSASLIQKCKEQLMDETLQSEFPAFACLQNLTNPQKDNIIMEHLINTWDLGMDSENSTSLRYLIR